MTDDEKAQMICNDFYAMVEKLQCEDVRADRILAIVLMMAVFECYEGSKTLEQGAMLVKEGVQAGIDLYAESTRN